MPQNCVTASCFCRKLAVGGWQEKRGAGEEGNQENFLQSEATAQNVVLVVVWKTLVFLPRSTFSEFSIQVAAVCFRDPLAWDLQRPPRVLHSAEDS